MAQILDGNAVRDAILAGLGERVAALSRRPGLAVVLVGHDPASEVYVRNKIRACVELGFLSEKISPPESVTTGQLLAIVGQLNARPEIDGILVQMPLPAQVDAKAVLDQIAPEKDVDGFHPVNVGRLVANVAGPRPCTPAGVIRLLKHYGIAISGKRAVVVGRSDIVGKPMAMLLLHENATVTICHSKTADLAAVCQEADILVAAIGRPAAITRAHIRPGAVVIDVGINRIDRREAAVAIWGEGSARVAKFDEKGSLLVGDAHPVDAAEIASAFTPVPGGVGPLTIAMLMSNTLEAAERRQKG